MIDNNWRGEKCQVRYFTKLSIELATGEAKTHNFINFVPYHFLSHFTWTAEHKVETRKA